MPILICLTLGGSGLASMLVSSIVFLVIGLAFSCLFLLTHFSIKKIFIELTNSEIVYQGTSETQPVRIKVSDVMAVRLTNFVRSDSECICLLDAKSNPLGYIGQDFQDWPKIRKWLLTGPWKQLSELEEFSYEGIREALNWLLRDFAGKVRLAVLLYGAFFLVVKMCFLSLSSTQGSSGQVGLILWATSSLMAIAIYWYFGSKEIRKRIFPDFGICLLFLVFNFFYCDLAVIPLSSLNNMKQIQIFKLPIAKLFHTDLGPFHFCNVQVPAFPIYNFRTEDFSKELNLPQSLCLNLKSGSNIWLQYSQGNWGQIWMHVSNEAPKDLDIPVLDYELLRSTYFKDQQKHIDEINIQTKLNEAKFNQELAKNYGPEKPWIMLAAMPFPIEGNTKAPSVEVEQKLNLLEQCTHVKLLVATDSIRSNWRIGRPFKTTQDANQWLPQAKKCAGEDAHLEILFSF